MSELGAMPRRKKLAKLIGLYGKCMLCHVLCFPFVNKWTCTHCQFIAPKSSETKHHAEFQIVVQFWNIYFLTLRLYSMITLCTFLPGNHKK